MLPDTCPSLRNAIKRVSRGENVNNGDGTRNGDCNSNKDEASAADAPVLTSPGVRIFLHDAVPQALSTSA